MNTNRNALHRVLLLASLVPLGRAGAQTIFVDTAADVVDFTGAQEASDLPGPDGVISFAEAALASDHTIGVQTIGFHVPPSEWTEPWLLPGRAVLKTFAGFHLHDTVVLDARTQTAFTGDTNPDGGGEVVVASEIHFENSRDSVAVGFDHTTFHVTGGFGNVLQGNTECGFELFDSASNRIGGANPGEGNTGLYVVLDRASSNIVAGNTLGRVSVIGRHGMRPPAAGNRIGGPNPGEGNVITGYGTWTSDGWPSGYAVQVFDAQDTHIEHNQIGMSPDGLHQGHLATTIGIYVDGENHGTVIRGNRIAGILGRRMGVYPGLVGTAIQLYGTGSGVVIAGNTLGLDAHGVARLGSVTGIKTVDYYLGPIQDVVVGGVSPGDGNEIAGQLGAGICIASSYAGVRIAGNSIHDNGGLGIDLLAAGAVAGVTPNDALDADSGANGLQNFPVLHFAGRSTGTLRVAGELESQPSSSFTLEFFASSVANASGCGEGQQVLGSLQLATDANGVAHFEWKLDAEVAAGAFVSATATDDASGSTSEFAAVRVVVDDPIASFCAGDGVDPAVRVACPCANFGAPGHGCAHSFGASGGVLAATGVPADDSVVLHADELPANSFALFLQHDALGQSVFHDGVACASGNLVRLRGRGAAGGSAAFPDAAFAADGTLTLAQRGGVSPGRGVERYYSAWYRNAAPSFCPPATANVTNGVRIRW